MLERHRHGQTAQGACKVLFWTLTVWAFVKGFSCIGQIEIDVKVHPLTGTNVSLLFLVAIVSAGCALSLILWLVDSPKCLLLVKIS